VSSETTGIKTPVPPKPRSSLGWKTVVPIVLVVLIAGCLILIIVASWPLRPISSSTSASTSTAADKEELLKAKLETYSKRADDLEKLASLLVGLSTVYAIALAVSAYTSVQGNIEQSKALVEEAKQSITKLETLSKEFQDFKYVEIQNLHQEVQAARDRADYAMRITIAYMVSDFPDAITGLQHQSIDRLLDLRDHAYAGDQSVNLCLAKLYRLIGDYPSSEDVLTRFLGLVEHAKDKDVAAIAAAYYDRACSRSLRLATAESEARERIIGGIKRDLKSAFTLDESCRTQAAETDPARKDPELDSVRDENWFKRLILD